jgi:hypothetical protein
MPIMQTRRQFLSTVSLAGAAGSLRVPSALAAEAAPETTTVRLVNDRSVCIAPEYMAEELLRAEGFTDIRYVEAPGTEQVHALLRGELDFANFFPGGNIPQIDAGGGSGQVESEQDHRRRHRLALFERAQARTEGVNAREKGGCQCRSFKRDAGSSAALHWPARPASCTTREWRPQRGPSKQLLCAW